MNDTFTPYEIGLTRLLERLGKEHPRYADALVYQQRLQENITQARKYGDTDALKHARAQIVDALNCLALETLGISFNKVSGASEENDSSFFLSSPPVKAVDNRSGGVYFKGEGTVHIRRDVVGGDQTRITHETHFYGPVTMPVHTGSGDVKIDTNQSPSPRTTSIDSSDSSIRRFRARLMAISTVVAVILGIASNIVAAYLQDQFNLLNDQGRFVVVVAVFTVTLAIGTWLAVKQGQGPL